MFVRDPAMKALNAQYRGKNYPTDVLSFVPASDIPVPSLVQAIGDIVISVDTARRYAKESKHLLTFEYISLLVHGILHLAGYEHENVSDKEASEMMELQKQIIEEVTS